MISKILIGAGSILFVLSSFPILLQLLNLLAYFTKDKSAGLGSFTLPLELILLSVLGFFLMRIGVIISYKQK